MNSAEWDRLTEAEKVELQRLRKLKGHTSVGEHQRMIRLQAREDAFGEACDWLKRAGYFEASAALEAVAFEVGT